MFLVIVLGMRRGPLGERGGTRAGKGKKKKKNNGLGGEGRRRKEWHFFLVSPSDSDIHTNTTVKMGCVSEGMLRACFVFLRHEIENQPISYKPG